jgi:hypothetical protein
VEGSGKVNGERGGAGRREGEVEGRKKGSVTEVRVKVSEEVGGWKESRKG